MKIEDNETDPELLQLFQMGNIFKLLYEICTDVEGTKLFLVRIGL